jgi:hypothetical protein
MFKTTKKRCEKIKNFGKTTFDDIKELKNIKELDGESIGIVALILVAVFGTGFLISLLPTWLYTIVYIILVLLLLYIKKVKHE